MASASESEDRTVRSLYESALLLRDPRLWRIFLVGMASGFPWVLHGSLLVLWLKDTGLSKSGIGLFGMVFTVYTINFLWAPVLDHLRLPLLHRMGHRRSWIFLCQAILFVCAVALAATGPEVSLLMTAVLALLISIASATQDMAIDAYRITIIREDESHLLGHAAAMATSGWWAGLSFPGWIALFVVNPIGWSNTYLMLSTFLVIVAIAVLTLFREPELQSGNQPHLSNRSVWRNMGDVLGGYYQAVEEFFRRNGRDLALGILLFIFLFKIGEAFLGKMVYVFYDDVGYTKEQIGTYSKAIGLVVTITAAILTGSLMARFGTMRGLLVAGLAMAGTNLIFSWIARVGPHPNLFLLAVVADGFTSAIATVAFVAFISRFTSRLHTATQYAAMASIGNAGRTTLAGTSGFLVEALDDNWALFFVLTAFMVVPALLILVWLAAKVKRVYGSSTT
ncbi:MAG: MFS transporter [Pseudomonadales bacterium]|nr:MFS transporter [Pseudomonadales bacterium]